MRDGCQGQGNGLDRAWLAGLLPFHSLFMGNGVAARRFLHAKQSRGLHCQILFHMAIAEAIQMQISAEQVLTLHRVASRYLKLVTSSNL